MGSGSAIWVTCLSIGLLLACCVTYDPLEVARGCEAYALGTCQSYARCSPTLIAAYGSLESCQAQLAYGCTHSLHQPDVLGTGAGAETCGVLMSGLDCSALWNGELPLECLPPAGRRGNGAACSVGAQCASARCWRAATESATGSCEELSDVGQACLGSGDCSPRLVCGPSNTCVWLARAGQACSEAQLCRAPLYCNAGVCSEPVVAPQLEARDPQADCEAFARAICTRLEVCSTFLVAGSYGSVDACITRTAYTCLDALALPDSSATALGIAGCATALSDVSCNAVLENALPEACTLVPGARVDGAACVADAQCESTRCARALASARCGSCAPPAPSEGQCVANTDCVHGLVCTSDGRCRSPAAQGAACDTTHPCSLPWVCAAGSCQPALELAATCDPMADRCNPYAALSCDYNTQRCAVWARSAAGQGCGYTAQGLAACVGAATCQLTDDWQGTCRAPAADGGACESSCHAPAQCRDGVCVLGSGGDCS
jgi:hypothetical protein